MRRVGLAGISHIVTIQEAADAIFEGDLVVTADGKRLEIVRPERIPHMKSWLRLNCSERLSPP